VISDGLIEVDFDMGVEKLVKLVKVLDFYLRMKK
jgi:hypothetical protein